MSSGLRSAVAACCLYLSVPSSGEFEFRDFRLVAQRLGSQRRLLVEIRSDDANYQTGQALGRSVVVPNEAVDDDGENLAHVADDGEAGRRDQRAGLPGYVAHRDAHQTGQDQEGQTEFRPLDVACFVSGAADDKQRGAGEEVRVEYASPVGLHFHVVCSVF
eukprot:CAMPEP_0197516148 /NCGR_PEP_ID=MMETSP1318-20131121/1016_1 /TAXON_ID=552666 /ORGANISM="Partenskyella glossopodia, Strain RCC365" /LENGTH=160 /DNA_ID=CAMNT_0043064671 /DNA_START=66 /DNA_END=549 /DNA_ORIENTATION=-